MVKNGIMALITKLWEGRFMKNKWWSVRTLILSLLVWAMMVFGPLANNTVLAATLYNDVSSSHWAYDNILKLSETGLLNGYPNGSFQPSNDVTYGEFLKMVALSSGRKVDDKTSKKNSTCHWSLPYYEYGIDNEYYSSERIGLGKLSYPIPRGDMALILSEMLGDWAIDDYEIMQKSITDIDYRNPDEYKIVKIYDAGILTGYPDGTFRPNETLNRAEAAAVITRFMKVKRKELFSVPEPPPGTELLAIEELIPNAKDIYLLKNVENYWINYDDPYTYEKARNYFGTAGLYIYPQDRSRKILFIIGDKVVYTSNALSILYWETGADEGSDLPDFDYIAVYPRLSDTVMLIPSPFK